MGNSGNIPTATAALPESDFMGRFSMGSDQPYPANDGIRTRNTQRNNKCFRCSTEYKYVELRRHTSALVPGAQHPAVDSEQLNPESFFGRKSKTVVGDRNRTGDIKEAWLPPLLIQQSNTDKTSGTFPPSLLQQTRNTLPRHTKISANI